MNDVQAIEPAQLLLDVVKPADGACAARKLGSHTTQVDDEWNPCLANRTRICTANFILIDAKVLRCIVWRNHDIHRLCPLTSTQRCRAIGYRSDERLGSFLDKRLQVLSASSNHPHSFAFCQ